MKLFLIVFTLVVVAVMQVCGWGGGGGGYKKYWSTKAPMSDCKGLPDIFHKCKDYVEAVKQKMKEHGRSPCKGYKHEDCYHQHAMEMKEHVKMEPSEECHKQIRDFFNKHHTTTPSTTTGESSTKA